MLRRAPAVSCLAALLITGATASSAWSTTGHDVQERLSRELGSGHAAVIHVVVTLCDNGNQGIVPVPEHLGNGQSPSSNLYWGARYGIRTYLSRDAGWIPLPTPKPADQRILDRAVFFRTVQRDGADVPVFIVADAWDGAHIAAALQSFFEIAAGRSCETIRVQQGGRTLDLPAGGAAHVVAYVGHNGLMDFSLRDSVAAAADPPTSSSIVLACSSRSYFLEELHRIGSHPLLLTTHLMAPEAYTLDAAVRSWIGNESAREVHEAAARAYHSYQRCGLTAARRLFWVAP